MEMIATMGFTCDDIYFNVEIYHKKYGRENYYKLFRNNILCADGKCPRSYSVYDIMNYHVGGVKNPIAV